MKRPRDTPAPGVEIVIPVYNEAKGLEHSVTRLRGSVAEQLRHAARITIADNASTDATLPMAPRPAVSLDGVGVLHAPPTPQASARNRQSRLRVTA
jgi:glycosyltransferase involved in cell wall biosynthesis